MFIYFVFVWISLIGGAIIERGSRSGFLVGRSMGAINAHVFYEKYQFEIY